MVYVKGYNSNIIMCSYNKITLHTSNGVYFLTPFCMIKEITLTALIGFHLSMSPHMLSNDTCTYVGIIPVVGNS